MTVYNRELREQERSSSEAEDFFDRRQGTYVKEGKGCETGSCKREAVCTVYVRNEEDYCAELEDAEGIPYRACRHHATKKTFNGDTILRAISEVLSDEETVVTPSIQNKSDPEPETQTTEETTVPTVRITPQGSPELQALLTSTRKVNPSPQERVSDVKESTVTFSDDGKEETPNQSYAPALNTSSTTAIASTSKQGNSTAAPKQPALPELKQTDTLYLTDEVDFPSLPAPSTSSQILGVTENYLGDVGVSEKRIGIRVRSRRGTKKQGGVTKRNATLRNQTGKANKQTDKLVAMETEDSSDEEVLQRFKHVMVPNVDHHIPFPAKPTNANALKLIIDGEPFALALDWAPLHLIKIKAKEMGDRTIMWDLKREVDF